MKRISIFFIVIFVVCLSLIACSAEVDVITTASIVDNAADLQYALSSDGNWIAGIVNDVTLDSDLIVEGEFMHNDAIARKIALYSQDEDRNKTEAFTLIAPRLLIMSENTKLQGGIFMGDIYVEANGFELVDMVVEGSILFKTQENFDTYIIGEDCSITETTEVQ